MLFLPELERIEVDTPPPSPIASIVSFETYDPQEITSPTKRTRLGSGKLGPSKKRKKTDATHSSPHEPDGATPESYCNSEEWPEASEASEETGEVSEDGYPDYVEAVSGRFAGFYPLSDELYIVQGWDNKSYSVKETWYHLQRVVAGDDKHVACVCPQGRNASNTLCVHERYIQEYHQAILIRDYQTTLPNHDGPRVLPNHNDKDVILFSRQKGEQGSYLNWFSVAGRQLGSHAVVLFDGNDTGMGSWMCMKDHESTCPHILLAQCELQDMLKVDGSHIDEWYELDGQGDEPTNPGEVSISYREIMPPLWCSLPSDQKLYERRQPGGGDPGTIKLEVSSRCTCGAKYSRAVPTSRIPCIVYGPLSAVDAEIEIQRCEVCDSRRRKFVGPDARDQGLFNWSNHILFTHDLLDEYTLAYSTSETPFAAWGSVITSRYETYQSRHPFVSVGLFRSAWFSFVRLQEFSNDMTCKICGPTPDAVIWDGVTVAFSKKKILPSLQPPTTTSSNSPSRGNIRYYPNQQLIPDRETRQLVLKALVSREQARKQDIGDEHGTDETNDTTSVTYERDHSEAVRLAEDRLKRLEGGLGMLFAQKLGSLSGTISPAPAYYELFRQICSNDTALRMGTSGDMAVLNIFILNPTPFNASRLISIPSLYHVLKLERPNEGPYPWPILGVAGWIYDRARDVLQNLADRGAKLSQGLPVAGEKDKWQEVSMRPVDDSLLLRMGKTGSFYSLPQIRSRPLYPGIKHEQESGDRGGKCSKYYNEYGKNQLTGGIMAVWCTHIICYGFHCIPKSEGRNDVFSAMVTRWPQAPKHVIYDFACSLGPYCMLCEPEFFADTKFLIDNFHASNHTKCNRAWFLSSYSAVYPQLAKVNSSAAECGNSGLHRIRKSISYMSQGRAVLYIKVFLAVWNRRKLKQMQTTTGIA